MIAKKRVIYSLVPPFILCTLLILIRLLEWGMDWDFSKWGINPRSSHGLLGILCSPFIHGSWKHLFANLPALLILGWFLYYFYKDIANRVMLFVWLVSGVLTWIIGRPASHVGASAIIYGLAFFLFFSGVFRRNTRLSALALIVVFLYGSILWNMFPIAEIIDPNVSWEGHLGGAISGLAAALVYRHKGPAPDPRPSDLEDEEEDLKSEDEEEYWIIPPASTHEEKKEEKPDSK